MLGKDQQCKLKEHQLLWGMYHSRPQSSGGELGALSNNELELTINDAEQSKKHFMVNSISILKEVDPNLVLMVIQMAICDLSKMLA